MIAKAFHVSKLNFSCFLKYFASLITKHQVLFEEYWEVFLNVNLKMSSMYILYH